MLLWTNNELYKCCYLIDYDNLMGDYNLYSIGECPGWTCENTATVQRGAPDSGRDFPERQWWLRTWIQWSKVLDLLEY